MESKFLDGMADETNWKKTENGADALNSTKDALIDLFGTIGALRTRSDSDIEHAFCKAYDEDKLLALKMLFYARNIRGGLGERNVFRVILKWMATRDPENIEVNFDNIANFGRWDDFYSFVDTPLEKDAFAYMKKQWIKDEFAANILEKDLEQINNSSCSLLGKWLKSANSHSKETRKLGLITAKYFGLSEESYRKSLSALRKYLKIVEVKMSAKEWKDISYEGVPSKAMNNYHGAFKKNDDERFTKYMDDVKKGVKKINADTLYPYDLVEKYVNNSFIVSPLELNDAIEAQWKALPNYIEGENNFMVMADTSASMNGRPLDTSVGLAIYFAERNHGPYKNKFMTFAAQPRFITLSGSTLKDKLSCVDWGICENTNIEAAFDLILKVAVDNKLEQNDLPKALIIISDMEFDEAQSYCGWGREVPKRETYTTLMAEKYAKYGYKLPTIVYWNVDARQDTFHAKASEPGIQFISGQSTSAFKDLIRGRNLTTKELMLMTLNDKMYDCVKLKA